MVENFVLPTLSKDSSTLRRRNLKTAFSLLYHITFASNAKRKTQKLPDILELCLRETLAGKSHYCRDVIVFVKLRFQNVFRPH